MKIKILVYKKDLGGRENECKTTDRSRNNCDEVYLGRRPHTLQNSVSKIISR